MEGCVDGASAFIDLTALYNEVLPQDSKLTASEWVHTWYKWWEKALACHDIPSTHLRKALPTKASASTDTGTRIFRHPSASLHATLLLLVRFSARSRGGKPKEEHIRVIWQNVLLGVLRLLQPQTVFEFTFFTDVLSSCSPSSPRTGSEIVPVQWMPDGTLHFQPLVESQGRLARDFSDFWHGATTMGLCEFLLECQAAGCRFTEFLDTQTDASGPQDQAFQPENQDNIGDVSEHPDVQQSRSRRERTHRKREEREKTRMQMRVFRDINIERTVCRHLLAARRHAQNVQHMSVAFDASR
eukprot:6444613-Amphidinium_carterae.1